jgi:4-diphosphocytidyl-2-C-methyl-D-erythritol kinase
MNIVEKAYAKINLSLVVLDKRDDGFHNIDSIIVPINLYDTLYFYENENSISLRSNVNIPNNIVLKAAFLIKEKYNVNCGVLIKLIKNIPIGAGLGGESADASATIRGLNKLWDLNLSVDEMESIALSLGSDTLFCLYNRPSIVRGRGDILIPFDYPEENIILYVPKLKLNTKNMFLSFDEDTNRLNSPDEKLGFNSFLSYALDKYSELNEIYCALKDHYLKVYFSGSGSAFFVFSNGEPLDIPLCQSLKTTIKSKLNNF